MKNTLFIAVSLLPQCPLPRFQRFPELIVCPQSRAVQSSEKYHAARFSATERRM